MPRMRGRVDYIARATGKIWGFEDWSITRGADGLRVFSAHCEMQFGNDDVVRDNTLSVHPDFHPHDSYVRIMNKGSVTGTGWFRFTDDEAECESWSVDSGRISQRFPIQRPTRGFGVHAVQGDGWLAATFPYDKGPGHTQFFGRNLIHSLHHFQESLLMAKLWHRNTHLANHRLRRRAEARLEVRRGVAWLCQVSAKRARSRGRMGRRADRRRIQRRAAE